MAGGPRPSYRLQRGSTGYAPPFKLQRRSLAVLQEPKHQHTRLQTLHNVSFSSHHRLLNRLFFFKENSGAKTERNLNLEQLHRSLK